eukprot:TRINITY_DN21431_c0_g1_i1.p2 TRINITY_DN21431_c0_g1~~TRINITY_DN21431_c0_g1_i1.p2  ORF type:complete len:127 (+),score=24.21 TRINITY_DN21431_c0_g1_i1:41-382(+)
MAEASAEGAAPTAANSREILRKLLGTQLRFVLSDERVVVGTFQCMDKHRNFIVADALETRQHTAAAPDGAQHIHDCERHLGLVMIPGKHLVSVCAAADALESARLRASSGDGV